MVESSEIAFEILVKGDDAGGTAAGAVPPRPAPERIERVRRALANRSIRCHPTAFGLVCYAEPGVFASVFGVPARKVRDASGREQIVTEGEPKPPADIADLIEQVTIPEKPELF